MSEVIRLNAERKEAEDGEVEEDSPEKTTTLETVVIENQSKSDNNGKSIEEAGQKIAADEQAISTPAIISTNEISKTNSDHSPRSNTVQDPPSERVPPESSRSSKKRRLSGEQLAQKESFLAATSSTLSQPSAPFVTSEQKNAEPLLAEKAAEQMEHIFKPPARGVATLLQSGNFNPHSVKAFNNYLQKQIKYGKTVVLKSLIDFDAQTCLTFRFSALDLVKEPTDMSWITEWSIETFIKNLTKAFPEPEGTQPPPTTLTGRLDAIDFGIDHQNHYRLVWYINDVITAVREYGGFPSNASESAAVSVLVSNITRGKSGQFHKTCQDMVLEARPKTIHQYLGVLAKVEQDAASVYRKYVQWGFADNVDDEEEEDDDDDDDDQEQEEEQMEEVDPVPEDPDSRSFSGGGDQQYAADQYDGTCPGCGRKANPQNHTYSTCFLRPHPEFNRNPLVPFTKTLAGVNLLRRNKLPILPFDTLSDGTPLEYPIGRPNSWGNNRGNYNSSNTWRRS